MQLYLNVYKLKIQIVFIIVNPSCIIFNNVSKILKKKKLKQTSVKTTQSIHNSRAPNINAVNIRQKVLDIPTNLSARTTVTENINEHFVQQYPICVQITNKIERHAPNKTFFVRFP